MKIFYLSRLWPQGMSFTRARVNNVSTLSTIVKLLICFFSQESSTWKSGITDLDIHMLKFCNFFFQSLNFLPISVISHLVHISSVVKCINFLLISLNLLHIHLLNYCILMYGLLPQFHLLMISNIMCSLLIIILILLGFNYLSKSMKSFLCLSSLNPWLKLNFPPKLRFWDQMVVGNMFPNLLNLFCLQMVFSTNYPAHKLPNKKVWWKGNIDIFLKPLSLYYLKLLFVPLSGLMLSKLLFFLSICCLLLLCIFTHLGLYIFTLNLILVHLRCLAVPVTLFSDLITLIS